MILDVGHGSGAVLHDEGGVVVFDTGGGPHVARYCRVSHITQIEAVFLSHADSDHVGGAVTLLLDKTVCVRCIFLNPDATKRNAAIFKQLRFAIAEAHDRVGTVLHPHLTSETTISRSGASIEVLYPPAVIALGGVGGSDLQGNRLSSNALSAAIRIEGAQDAAVLLAGDIESNCLEYWQEEGINPKARALVFPHHGGLAGVSDAKSALFAKELSRSVNPETVIFSIHRTRFDLPRDSVLSAILEVIPGIRIICTQLPEKFCGDSVQKANWSLHFDANTGSHRDGDLEIEFAERELMFRFLSDTSTTT